MFAFQQDSDPEQRYKDKYGDVHNFFTLSTTSWNTKLC